MNPQNNPHDLDSLLDRVVLDDPSPEAEAELLRRLHGAGSAGQPAEGGMPGVIFGLFALAAVALLSVVLLNLYNRSETNALDDTGAGHFLNPDDFRQKVRCAGVFTEHVIFEDSISGEQSIYTVGQSLHGYTITFIEGERVTLTGVDDPSDTFTVKLSAGQGGGDGGAGVLHWFAIRGALTDGDGRPVSGWVSAYDEQNQWIAGAEAKADGHYSLKSRSRVAYLQAASVDYSVLSKRVGSWTADAREDFSLADDRFVIQGRVTQSGKGVPYAQVIAWHGPRQMATVAHADRDGAYELKTNRMVFSMKVQLGQQTLVQEGPWQASGTVDFSMNETFAVTGSIYLDGEQFKTGSLTGYSDANEPVVTGYVDVNGAYRLTSAMPFSHIVFSFRPVGGLVKEGEPSGMCAYVLPGFWSRDASGADIRMTSQEFHALAGTVTDASGRPSETTVVAIRRFGDGREYNLAVATSGLDGRYRIQTNAEVSVMAAFTADRWNRIDGPWSRSATVDFRIGEGLAPQRLLDLNVALQDEAKRFNAYLELRELLDRFGDVKAGDLSAVALMGEIEGKYGSRLAEQTALNARLSDDLKRMTETIEEQESLLDVSLAKEYAKALADIGETAPDTRVRAAASSWSHRLNTALKARPLIGFNFDASPEGEGVQVGSVVPGSPAARDGLKPADRILRIDGNAIASQDDVFNLLSGRKAGDRIALEVEREREGVVTLYITLGLRFQ